ncbi:MAG: hypothetical protein ACLP1X_18515 [Polyangiaceae bacterium]|jgi:hypothetical protein
MSWGASKAALVGVLAGLLVTAAIMATALRAEAKSSYESPYGFDRTWNAALRLVRVDNGWNVTEKDEAGGYLLFDYKSPESPKPTPGSLELVRGHEADAPVSVLVQLPQMPRYHEQVLIDALSSKMRREYGDPPAHKRPPPSQETPDGGGDAGDQSRP